MSFLPPGRVVGEVLAVLVGFSLPPTAGVLVGLAVALIGSPCVRPAGADAPTTQAASP